MYTYVNESTHVMIFAVIYWSYHGWTSLVIAHTSIDRNILTLSHSSFILMSTFLQTSSYYIVGSLKYPSLRKTRIWIQNHLSVRNPIHTIRSLSEQLLSESRSGCLRRIYKKDSSFSEGGSQWMTLKPKKNVMVQWVMTIAHWTLRTPHSKG